MDIFSVLVGAAIFLAGIVTSSFSEVIGDLLSEPYHHWKDKKGIKKENIETVRSLIADFCSSWELFKCRTILHVDLEKDLLNSCRDIYSIISKNERDFRKNETGTSIKNLCKKFINLHPQNDDCSGWSRGAENQIDELYTEFKKYMEMLEKW